MKKVTLIALMAIFCLSGFSLMLTIFPLNGNNC